MSVFISYTWHSKAFAEATASLLASQGISYWRDDEQVRPGDVLLQRLGEGISACSVVLVLLSPHYVRSENCSRETQLAFDYHKPRLVILLPGINFPPPVASGKFAAQIAFALTGTTYLASDGVTPPADKLIPALAKQGIVAALATAQVAGQTWEAEFRAKAAEAVARELETELASLRLRALRAESRAAAALDPFNDSSTDGGSTTLLGARVETPTSSMPPEQLVDIMRSGGRNAQVAMLACQALYNAIASNICIALKTSIEADSVSAIVAILTFHSGNAAVVEEACAALFAISHDPVGKFSCVAENAVSSIVLALQTHTRVATMAEQACYALSKIASHFPSGKTACDKAEATTAIVAALTWHMGNPAVSKSACLALQNICTVSPAASGVLNAVSAVVAVLNVHRGDLGVVIVACRALFNVILENSEGLEASLSSEAVPAILFALTEHLNNTEAAEEASALLSIVATCDAGRKSCVVNNAVPTIVSALERHSSNAAVAEQACNALRYIAADNTAGQEACVAALSVPSIVAALAAHQSVLPLVENACAALNNIAICNSGKNSCAEFNAVPGIVAVLECHITNAAVAKKACHALSCIAANNSAGQDACIDANAARAIVSALTRHISVAECACWALHSISRSSDGQKSCLAANAVPVIVSVLKSNYSAAHIATSACGALGRMALNNSAGQIACISAGAVPYLTLVHAAHGDDARKFAHHLLAILGFNDDGTKK